MAYFGGKLQDGVYQTIINQIPMHDRYIEPFLGGGAIMKKKRLAKINIGIEKNNPVADSFSTMLPKVKIFNGCGIDFLRSLIPQKTYGRSGGYTDICDPPKTFIYCDPPYPYSTRGMTRYKFDFTNIQHVELLGIIKQLPFDIAISTYPNILYSEMLRNWKLAKFTSVDRSGAVRTEHLYMNYDQPFILHDDSYIGENSNNRQDIKRRIRGTKKRLLRWDSRERVKLLRILIEELPDFEKKYLFPGG